MTLSHQPHHLGLGQVGLSKAKAVVTRPRFGQRGQPRCRIGPVFRAQCGNDRQQTF